MTLRHLKIFVAVCEHKSTTKASEALYIVQPTISHSIAELEKYYNVTLFDRVNQRLVLTDVGKELLIKAKEILAGFEDFESLATFGGQSPKVRIGASLTLGQTFIPKLFSMIRESNSIAEPRVLIRPSISIEAELEQGNLDFAIIGGDIISPYLLATPLSNDRFVAVSHVDYEIPDKLTLLELAKYPLLLRERGSASRDFLEKEASKEGIKLNTIMDSSNNQALVSALYAKLGVGFLPESYVLGHINRKKFKEITIKDLSADRTNNLVIHKNKKLNPIQQEIYNLIKTI